MCLAQLSKIICYNPHYPYLIIIPTVLLSAGMLFFFTLGSSMVGDICDEDELKRGYRSEGSFYSIFWWFIKMGTALASFVGGALIVFTMFDETQVTKIDKLQGNIGEMHSKIEIWKGDQGMKGTSTALFETTKKEVAEALVESNKYMSYLEKETTKTQETYKETDTAYQNKRKELLLNVLETTKTTTEKLGQMQSELAKVNPQGRDSLVKALAGAAFPLTMQTKFEKTKVTSFELTSHLRERSLNPKSAKNEKSKAHYDLLLREISGVSSQLININLTSSPDALDKDLNIIEEEIRPLTKQTPYTLLMMRVVEIGLPLLLSIFSVFFVLRYSLTEKRSHEIKDLLKKRNEENANDSNTPDPVTV